MMGEPTETTIAVTISEAWAIVLMLRRSLKPYIEGAPLPNSAAGFAEALEADHLRTQMSLYRKAVRVHDELASGGQT